MVSANIAVVWTAAQVAVIFLQDSYGPRFFVPKQYLPFKYDYHRKLPRTVGAIRFVCPFIVLSLLAQYFIVSFNTAFKALCYCI